MLHVRPCLWRTALLQLQLPLVALYECYARTFTVALYECYARTFTFMSCNVIARTYSTILWCGLSLNTVIVHGVTNKMTVQKKWFEFFEVENDLEVDVNYNMRKTATNNKMILRLQEESATIKIECFTEIILDSFYLTHFTLSVLVVGCHGPFVHFPIW